MNHRDTDNDFRKGQRIAREISEIIDGSCDPANLPELAEFLDKSDSADELISRMTDSSRASSLHRQVISEDKQLNIHRLKQSIARVRFRRRVRIAVSASAAVLIVGIIVLLGDPRSTHLDVQKEDRLSVAVPTLILDNGCTVDLEQLSQSRSGIEKIGTNRIKHNTADHSLKMNLLVIPSCYTYSIVLDDGTEVFMNANSTLKYPTRFSGDRRSVSLSGEAYFKVTKSDRPFVVSVDNIEVTVLGTEFCVNSHKKDCIETILVSGLVKVGSGAKSVSLSPGQIATYNRNTGQNRVARVDVQNYISWKEGVFRYKNSLLGDVLSDMAAWYGVEIDYTQSIGNIEVTLFLNREIPLPEMIDFIEIMTEIKFKREEGKRYSVEKP